MERRAFLQLAAVVLALAALACPGCLSSPTLPLPPPSPDEPTVPVAGQTRLSGSVPNHQIGVRVLALNSRTQLIYGEYTASSRFSFTADAVSGDVFVIWYTAGEEASEPVEVAVPYASGSAPPVSGTPDAAAGDAAP